MHFSLSDPVVIVGIIAAAIVAIISIIPKGSLRFRATKDEWTCDVRKHDGHNSSDRNE